MKLSLRTAAKQAGVSKTTIIRAIKSGRLSAPRDDDGNFAIDPAELFRVYPPGGPSEDQGTGSSTGSEDQDAPPKRTAGTTPVPMDHLEVRLARAEASLEALKEVLELERKRAEELRQERDKWSGIAEASHRQIMDLTKRPKGVFGWLRRA